MGRDIIGLNMSDATVKRIRIPSDMGALDRVLNETEAFVLSFVESDDEVMYRVALVTTEAVTNAMKHGNRLDPSKSVQIEWKLAGRTLSVTVEDEGPGFDHSAIADPLADENLLRDYGRGVFLIRSMADEVEYDRGGRRVRMTFHLDTETEDQAAA